MCEIVGELGLVAPAWLTPPGPATWLTPPGPGLVGPVH